MSNAASASIWWIAISIPLACSMIKVALGAGLALGFAAAPHGTAHAEPAPVIEEDSPQWDCRYDGNRICGVGATLPDGSHAIPR